MNEELPIHHFTGLQAVGIVAGRPVYPIMGGSDDHEEADTDTSDDSEDQDIEDHDDSDDEDRPLGEKGEKALERIKEKEKAGRLEKRELKKQLAELQRQLAEKDKPTSDDEHVDPEQLREQIRQELSGESDIKILRAEVRAIAAGILEDPNDALNFLDLSEFEVTADGEVDADELTDALNELVEKKPYLKAAQSGKRFEQSVDLGVRKASKVTTEDKIAQAEKDGNHTLAIQLKNQLVREKSNE